MPSKWFILPYFLLLGLALDHSIGFSIPPGFRSIPIDSKTRRTRIRFQSWPRISAAAEGSDNNLFAPQQEKRKEKKNKYAKFSKADKIDQDPFEALLKESEEKLKKLQEKDQKKIPKVSPQEVKPLEFPDSKNIDPYDPATFGYIEIGTIQAPHGVHGWMKVQGCTDFPERLTKPGMLLHMKQVNKRAPRKVTLAAGKNTGRDAFIIQLEGLQNRTAVQKLKGATLYYATQQDTLIEEEGILVSDMVGLEVRLENGDLVGSVDGIVLAEEICSIPGLGQDMLEVALIPHKDKPFGAPKDLVLIPYVPQIVPKVNMTDRVVTIDPPAGLLDLTYIREKKVRIRALLAPAKD